MITSKENLKIKQVRALLAKRSEREAQQAFVVEGVRLAEEGLAAGWQASLVLVAENLSERGRAVAQGFARLGVEVEEVSNPILQAISDTETTQGLLVVFAQRPMPLPAELNFVLITDRIRDPGNLGTMLRTAVAAGVQAVLLPPETTDAFAPKVVRSAMGAHFRLPLLSAGWDGIEQVCRSAGLHVYLAEAGPESACWKANFRQGLALLLGSEAEGASSQGRALANEIVSIPMPGNVESLNAAVAAGILLFEVVRQRSS